MSDQTPPRAGRRATDPPLEPAIAASNLPATRPAPAGKAGPFDAQLLMQGQVRRGLKGGKEVLDAARSTYLQTEWSGPADRRPRKGQLTKTNI